jgi:hypothetical protein
MRTEPAPELSVVTENGPSVVKKKNPTMALTWYCVFAAKWDKFAVT